MSGDIPLEITHLRERLRSDFTTRIPEAQVGANADEKERNFLSRALAGFAVHKLSGCTLELASTSIVDGGGDCGIDAIYYCNNAHRLWLVQSKFFSDGTGEPGLGDVSKFKDGVEAMLQGQFNVFATNRAIRERIDTIKSHFTDAALEVVAVLVYSGRHTVSDDRIRLFETLRQRFSADSEYFTFKRFNLTSVHDWLRNADAALGVESVDLTLYSATKVATPYETYFGLVKLSDLAALHIKHGDQLVVANIRNYKGSTEVNDHILNTIQQEPEHFFYLNNGLTAYCQRIEIHNLDRGSDTKRIKAYGFSIVNGAQTAGTVAVHFAGKQSADESGFVFVKVISLQACEDNFAFAQRITHSTNFQNQIGPRDFAALDEEQDRICSHLALSGIEYHYKDSAETPAPDETHFSLDEATTALACLEQFDPAKGLDFCCRVLSNRKSLWSQEESLPVVSDYRSPYRRLFRLDRSARTVWRAVQTQRLVVEQMKNNGRAANGKRKEFFENSRWLVLHVAFLRLHAERGNDLTLTENERGQIRQQADVIAEEMWGIAELLGQHRHFKSVFCDTADCRRLKTGTMERLASKDAQNRES